MKKNKYHLQTIKKKAKDKAKAKVKARTKKTTQSKKAIIDVPLSSKLSKGSHASVGSIDYHYRKYYNTFEFISKILQMNKKLRKIVCIPDVGSGWMKAFLKIRFFKDKRDKYPLKSINPVDSVNSVTEFISAISECMSYRLIPINLEIIVPDMGTHANIILMDTTKKTVELFEPHGSRDSSELEGISKAYITVSKNVRRFFKLYFPHYRYVPPSEYEPKEGLQARLDAFSGTCVTWSILYVHYRILNPTVPQRKLVNYLDKKVTRNFLLRYTRYVEEVLKGKV